MRILMYSDLHLKEDRIDDAKTVLDRIGEIAQENKVQIIVNGGDTFNTRGVIRTRCLKTLYDAYRKWQRNGLKQYILVGNHDQEDRAGLVHPMKIFEQFPDWHVIDKPEKLGNLAFIPYCDPKNIKKFIKGIAKPGVICFVHLGIQGAMMNDFVKDSEGIPANWFVGFKVVFSGHYHYRHKFKNIQYIGSPMQHSFAEMGQDKGVLIYDSLLKKIDFVSIEGVPRHHEINVYWQDGKKQWTIPKGILKIDRVRVKIRGESEQVFEIDKDLLEKKFDCSMVKIHREILAKTVSRMNLDQDEIYDKNRLMKKYVDFVDTDLNKTRALEIGTEIVNASV